MELREQFEKLHPVPEGMYFRGPDYSFDDPVGDTFGCAVYNALWQGFQSGHAAGLDAQERSIALLTQSRDRCIAENTRLAKRVAELDPANCHPMRLNAAMKEPK